MASIVLGLCGLRTSDFLDDWEVWNCGRVEEVFKGVLDEQQQLDECIKSYVACSICVFSLLLLCMSPWKVGSMREQT